MEFEKAAVNVFRDVITSVQDSRCFLFTSANPLKEKSLHRCIYIRSVKKPASLADRVPPWFERLRTELHRDRSPCEPSTLPGSVGQTASSKVRREATQNEGLHEGSRYNVANAQRSPTENENSAICRLNQEGNHKHE